MKNVDENVPFGSSFYETFFGDLNITWAYFLSAKYKINPSIPQESASPMPTVSIMSGMGSGVP